MKHNQREARDALIEELRRGPITANPAAVAKLTDAIWECTHDESMDRDTMLAELSMLSGMAVVGLMHYRSMLEVAQNG